MSPTWIWTIASFPHGDIRNQRGFGEEHTEPRLCDQATCPNTRLVDGQMVHRERLGGNHIRFGRKKKYRITEKLIRYLCGFPDPEVVR